MMKYKVGDRVKIAQIYEDQYWYGEGSCGEVGVNEEMEELSGGIAKITHVCDGHYRIDLDRNVFMWVANMFEGRFDMVSPFQKWENSVALRA